jgi:cytochrome c biogenesis protein CcdA
MDAASLGLAFLAGTLSTLSPCVLPLLPAILMGATAQHRFGPLALAAGLALSFAGLGLFVATVGYTLGLTGDVFRIIGAVMMMTIGAVLLVPAAQVRLAMAAGPLQTWTESRFGGLSTSGPRGQFALGLLLGVVWAPCVGPTLGAASLLAAQGKELVSVVATTLVFAIGTAVPLLALAQVSRAALKRWTRRLASGSGIGKLVLGAALVSVGLLVITGLDKTIEALLVSASPVWLTELTTRF